MYNCIKFSFSTSFSQVCLSLHKLCSPGGQWVKLIKNGLIWDIKQTFIFKSFKTSVTGLIKSTQSSDGYLSFQSVWMECSDLMADWVCVGVCAQEGMLKRDKNCYGSLHQKMEGKKRSQRMVDGGGGGGWGALFFFLFKGFCIFIKRLKNFGDHSIAPPTKKKTFKKMMIFLKKPRLHTNPLYK